MKPQDLRYLLNTAASAIEELQDAVKARKKPITDIDYTQLVEDLECAGNEIDPEEIDPEEGQGDDPDSSDILLKTGVWVRDEYPKVREDARQSLEKSFPVDS